MHRKLLQYLARHPQMQKMVKEAADKASKAPSFKKMQDKAKAFYNKTFAEATVGSTAGKGQQQAQGKPTGDGGPQFSFFNEMKRKIVIGWHQNRGRIIAFITANFFMIIMAFQFFPVLMGGLKAGADAITGGAAGKQRRIEEAENEVDSDGQTRRQREEMSRQDGGQLDEEALEMRRHRYVAQEERPKEEKPKHRTPFTSLASKLGDENEGTPFAVSPPKKRRQEPSAFSFDSPAPSAARDSGMRDDTSAYKQRGKEKANLQSKFNDMHRTVYVDDASPSSNAGMDFNTSFLVKMGDETEFTSSLDRDKLTGGSIVHQ